MKKSFLMLGVAAMALASCTNEEVLNVADSRAISFDNAFVNNSTRSVNPSLTKESLNDFDVYGFVTNSSSNSSQIFDGVKVYKNEDGTKWTYDNPQYWVNGNTYTFGAIAPSGAATVSGEAITGATNKKVGMTVQFTNTNDAQKDLLHATPDVVTVSSDEYNKAVEMTFSHQLSKVKFSFKNSVGVGYSVKVTNVKITDAMSSGTLTVSGELDNPNKWSDQQGTLELNFGHAVANTTDTEADAIANGGTNETYYEKLMIPTPAATSYTVTFTTELIQGTTSVGTFNHSVKIVNVELQLGYSYNFTAELNAENIGGPDNPSLNPITFTVESVKGWASSDEGQNLDLPTTTVEP